MRLNRYSNYKKEKKGSDFAEKIHPFVVYGFFLQ